MDDSNGQEKGNGTHIANGGKIPAVVVHPYPGRGTLDDPYIVRDSLDIIYFYISLT
jgi:hypothetical protein